MTVNNDKLNLEKGQSVDINEEAGKILKKLKVGLGWDMNTNSRVDLDASVIAFDASGTKLGQVFYNEKTAFNGGIVHSGDNVTGEGDGDDEVIAIDADKLPGEVAKLLITITNYTEQPLKLVKNAFARIVDADTNNELVRFTLKELGANTALFMVKLVKNPEGGFTMTALGEAANGKTFADLLPAAGQHL